MENRTTTREPTLEETRTSMTEKMELLEDRVRETVEGTRSAVEHIVDNVKGTVEETVGSDERHCGRSEVNRKQPRRECERHYGQYRYEGTAVF